MALRERSAVLDAVHVVGTASLDFDLYGRMRDMKTMLYVVHDGADDLLSFPDALLGDHDVAAAGDDAGTDHPHVQIVDVEHARDRLDRGNHRRHVGAGRRALE